jgi:hypothetical protein
MEGKMRRLCVLTASLIAASLLTNRPAAGISYDYTFQAEGCMAEGAESCQVQGWDSSAGCGRGLYCQTCGVGERRWLGPRCADRVAEVGDFNCTCRGSYNYPVPPQYTYHWPGMYSQQTMTEYASPWRFPPLEDYRGTAAGIGVQDRRLVELPSPPPLGGSSNLEPLGP